jgi:predicted  nucleic acid-binding Zn-ribbon protein
VELHEMELAEVDERQGAARGTLAGERASLDERAAAVIARRAERARAVSAGALTKYERLRKRGQRQPLVKLHDTSCGNCHVAVPMSRRLDLMAGRALEVCEGCGVLLYASM